MQIMAIDTKNTDEREMMKEYLPEDILDLEELTVWSAVYVNLATDEKYITGFLAFVQEPSGIRIVYLYVLPEYRGLGAADRLLDELAFRLKEAEYTLPVTMFLTGDLQQDMLGFISGRGDYYVNPSSDYIIIPWEQIIQSDYVRKLQEYDNHAELLFDKSIVERRRINNVMMAAGIPYGDDIQTDGADYIRELCFCNILDGQINALCLVREAQEKQLELSFVYAMDPKGLANVLSCLTKSAMEQYPQYSLAISVVNQNSRKLAEGFFGESECERHTVYCAVWNGLLREELVEMIAEDEEE